MCSFIMIFCEKTFASSALRNDSALVLIKQSSNCFIRNLDDSRSLKTVESKQLLRNSSIWAFWSLNKSISKCWWEFKVKKTSLRASIRVFPLRSNIEVAGFGKCLSLHSSTWQNRAFSFALSCSLRFSMSLQVSFWISFHSNFSPLI